MHDTNNPKYNKHSKIDLKKGAATFTEFAFCGVFLTYLFLVIAGLFIQRYTIERCNLRADQIARNIVVCTSMEEAEELVEEQKVMFDLPYVTEINIYIDYVPGSDYSWRKGNFINILFDGKIKTVTFWTESRYTFQITKMIENSGGLFDSDSEAEQ